MIVATGQGAGDVLDMLANAETTTRRLASRRRQEQHVETWSRVISLSSAVSEFCDIGRGCEWLDSKKRDVGRKSQTKR